MLCKGRDDNVLSLGRIVRSPSARRSNSTSPIIDVVLTLQEKRGFRGTFLLRLKFDKLTEVSATFCSVDRKNKHGPVIQLKVVYFQTCVQDKRF